MINLSNEHFRSCFVHASASAENGVDPVFGQQDVLFRVGSSDTVPMASSMEALEGGSRLSLTLSPRHRPEMGSAWRLQSLTSLASGFPGIMTNDVGKGLLTSKIGLEVIVSFVIVVSFIIGLHPYNTDNYGAIGSIV